MSLGKWAVEVVRTLPSRTHLPGAAITPRAREDVILAVADAHGERWSAWVHRAWRDALGAVEGDAATDAMLDHARACAVAGQPVETGAELRATLPPATMQAFRATIARAEVEAFIGERTDELIDRLSGRRPLLEPGLVVDATTAILAAPLAGAAIGFAAALRVVQRTAPPLPDVRVEPEPNLLAHLLEKAVHAMLASAGNRLVVLNVPITATLAFRAGRSAASIRLGRGRVEIVNDVASDAWLVLEGEIEPLMRLASGSILRELASLRVRPS